MNSALAADARALGGYSPSRKAVMTSTRKWKSNLLSSGLPLEFEAARLLAANGFSIFGEHKYSRHQSDHSRDFSVDIKADWYMELPNFESAFVLELLVECKYRHPSVRWLFLPDPNVGDFALGSHGAINAIDAFTSLFVNRSALWKLHNSFPYCIKGTEVNEATATVSDSELREALSQLQFGLPSLMSRAIAFNYGEDMPFAICPILLTTARLFVAHDDLTIKAIESADALEDIGRAVPYLVVNYGFGPDFEAHARHECKSLVEIGEDRHTKNLAIDRATKGDYQFELPDALAKGLATGEAQYLVQYFGQFIVCSWNGFPRLVRRIKRASERVGASTRKRSFNANVSRLIGRRHTVLPAAAT